MSPTRPAYQTAPVSGGTRFWSWEEGQVDRLLFSLIFILAVSGLMVLMAVDAQSSHPYRYFRQQGFSFLVGTILFFIGLEFPLSFWRRYQFPLMLFSFFLMAAVFIPGVGQARDSSSHIPRWIGIPLPGLGTFSFQPVELAKIAIILYLSHHLLENRQNKQRPVTTFLFPLTLIGGVVLLTALQPNYGSAMLLILIAITLIFVAGINLRNLFLTGLIIAPLAIIGLVLKPYRSDRLLIWANPYQFPDKAFQILESFRAFHEGKLVGQFIGSGRAHRLLPDRHNDFVFAIVAHDYGMLGALALVAVYLLFTLRAVYVLRQLADAWHRVIGFGIVGMVSIQAFLNMAVVTGLVPTTGISLPLISLGGSNLIVNMLGLGILLNLSGQERSRE